MDIDKENIVQAVVIMDTFNNNFNPINKCMGMLQAAGVPLLDYVLESLALGGVSETVLFCCQDGAKIKEHVKQCVLKKGIWSLSMDVQVMMSDCCQTMGDVMREIDAASIVKGHFILLGVNSIANIPFAALLEQHKQTAKKDKGAAMTLVYKKVSWGHPLISNDRPTFVAADARTKKVLLHQKYKHKSEEKTISLPLEIILSHSEVNMHHNLADVNISLCSPSVPPLFSDNFDFQTREDFIHGILINEEILASSLYYVVLKEKQYAASITNWKTFQVVCRDILHHWAHPLSIETGSFYQDNYLFMGNHNYKHKASSLSRSSTLVEDVLVGEDSQISDNTTVKKSFIGRNCTIGKNVTITSSYLCNNVTVEDNCVITNSFIDDHSVIGEETTLNSSMVTEKSVLPARTVLNGTDFEEPVKIEKQKSTSESGTEWENESGGDADEFVRFNQQWSASGSCYSTASSRRSSLDHEPLQEDTNIFLQEVIDSLARGYEEKLKCDYLILEINSSRYAYNIQLHEVNFYMVRALLSMPCLTENKNVLNGIKDILKFFKPVLDNYIKTKSSIMDCLRAVEESCVKCEWLEGRAGQIIHLLYGADVVDEDSLTEWYGDLKENESPIVNQTSLVKFFEWLQEASEESEESD